VFGRWGGGGDFLIRLGTRSFTYKGNLGRLIQRVMSVMHKNNNARDLSCSSSNACQGMEEVENRMCGGIKAPK